MSRVIMSFLIGLSLLFPFSAYALTDSANLNGSTQYFSRAYSSILNNAASNMSVCAWVYMPTLPASGDQWGVVSMWDNVTGGKGWYMQFYNDGTTQYVQLDPTGASFWRIPWTPSVNTWENVCYTENTSGTIKVYVNGSLDTNTPSSGGTLTGGPANVSGNATPIHIGNWISGTTFFPGNISQVEVFGAELSATDIANYYCYQFTGSETNIEGSWSLDNTTADLSVNTFTLTNNGSTPFTANVPSCVVPPTTTTHSLLQMVQAFWIW